MNITFDPVEASEKMYIAGADGTLRDPVLLMQFLRMYSLMFLNGETPSGCEKTQHTYWNNFFVRNDYKKIAEMVKEITTRTLVPNFKGIKYFPAIGKHVNSDTLTDEDAINYLKEGVMSEEMFKTLPENYTKKTKRTKKSK